MTLTDLGISVGDQDIYRFLLAKPSTIPVIAKELLLDERSTEAAMRRMTDLNLISVSTAGVVKVRDPKSALDGLARRRFAESLNDFYRAAEALGTMPAVLAELGVGEPGLTLEAIESHEEVNSRILAELAARPGKVVRKTTADGGVRRIQDAGRSVRTMQEQQSTHYRTLIRASILSDPIQVAWYRQMQQAGDDIRVTTDHLQAMVLIDRDRAFVTLEDDNPSAGAVFIRHPGTIGTLVDLFDRAWPSALGLDVGLTSEISMTERQVLSILTETTKDEIAARRLNMSVRTFRRHVSDLMERLDASNRFQLAVLAKDKGWM